MKGLNMGCLHPSVLNFFFLVNIRILLDGLNRQEIGKMIYAIKGSTRFANGFVPDITLKPTDFGQYDCC